MRSDDFRPCSTLDDQSPIVSALGYDQIALWLNTLGPQIHGRYTALIALLRGGTFPAMVLAHATGLPVYFTTYDRAARTPHWHGHAAPVGPVLLCEDIAGSGHTLSDTIAMLHAQGYAVDTLTICADALSRLSPTHVGFTTADANTRFILPWEQHELNPAVLADRMQGIFRPDHSYHRTAWDLDGVFCDDLPPHDYDRDLAATLIARDGLSPHAAAPQPGPHDVIITGRPTEDTDRTRDWLTRHGWHHPVHHRPRPDVPDHPTHVARWKAETAVTLGCTHFVESDAHQALIIHRTRPALQVIWWNSGDGVVVMAQ